MSYLKAIFSYPQFIKNSFLPFILNKEFLVKNIDKILNKQGGKDSFGILTPSKQ